MKTMLKITIIASALVLLAPEADAVFGVRRRTAVVTATVVHSEDSAKEAQSQQQAAAAQQQTTAAQQQTAAAQQQTAAAQQQTAAAQQEATAPKQQAVAPPAAAPAPAAAGAPLPIGTVVSALPPGCVSTPVGGEESYYGGGNFYRAVFQGNNLVYVTAQPK